MPTNLHALIRYRTIDKCLRDTDRSWKWQDLAEACRDALLEQTGKGRAPSRRTIMYDIDHMRSGKLGYHAPIEFDHTEGSYYYSDRKFSIDHVPLKAEDMDDLNNALLILKQFSGKENIQGLQEILARLETSLKIRRSGRKIKPIFHFEHSLNTEAHQWLNDIQDAIRSERVLTIGYQPFEREVQYMTISPYALKEYNGRWFLLGHNHSPEINRISHLGLDRIKSIKLSVQEYILDKEFAVDAYLKDIIGISIPDGVEKQQVIFRAFGRQARYIETKPLHSSQMVIDIGKDYTDFQIEVIPNFELEARLLSYGENVEVISPEALRIKLSERVHRLSSRYS